MTGKYTVGYGKPPVATRFKKGESGNPKGRAKGSKNVSTMVLEALSEQVVIVVDGRRRKVSKLEAGFMQQANKAAAGDAKAVKLMVDILASSDLREAAKATGDDLSPEARRELDAMLIASLKSRMQGGDDEED